MGIAPGKTLTADLCDSHDRAQVANGHFFNFGGSETCIGPADVIATDDDNSLVAKALRGPGEGRVLVVDNGGSTTCAMVGGDLGRAAHDNGWCGIVVNGAIRDVVELRDVPIPIYALASCPRKSVKRDIGSRGETIDFMGITVRGDDIVAADPDGVVFVSAGDFEGI